MNWLDLRKMLDKDLQRQFRTKREFVAWATEVQDPKRRVGGPHGPGRITVKRALNFLD